MQLFGRTNRITVTAVRQAVLLLLVGAMCSGCFNQLFGRYSFKADISTNEDANGVATIKAGTWRFECWIARPVQTKTLIVDPVLISFLVVCDPQLTFTQFEQDFLLDAVAGHAYEVTYGLTECMRLEDKTANTIIEDHCPP